MTNQDKVIKIFEDVAAELEKSENRSIPEKREDAIRVIAETIRYIFDLREGE